MITSVTLRQGAVRMARRGVIVKHLPAIQNFGSIDVLCSDKTGTLTTGEMQSIAPLDPRGAPSDAAAARWLPQQPVRDGHSQPARHGHPARADRRRSGYMKVDEIPFDFERRRLSVVVEAPERPPLLVTKGAPEAMLRSCTRRRTRAAGSTPLDRGARESVRDVYERLSAEGFRVLAVAYR